MKNLLHRGIRCCGLIIAVIFMSYSSAFSQTYKDHEIKAAFIFNFGKFIEWPASSLADNRFVIGILGPDYFKGTMQIMVRNKRIGSKEVFVINFITTDEIQKCHILFVHPDMISQMDEINKKVGKFPTLIVSNYNNFCVLGGMINLIKKPNGYGFEINKKLAEGKGLKLSSWLLRLARVIE